MRTQLTNTSVYFRLLAIGLAIGSTFVSSIGLTHAQSAGVEYALAAGYYSRGQWSESGEAFVELIRKYPGTNESASARFFLAEVMMQNQDFESALNQFHRFLEDFPHHQHATRAIFRIGEAAYRTEQFNVAVERLENFIDREPNHELSEFAYSYLGEIRLQREDPAQAQIAFEAALKLTPNGNLSNQYRIGLAKAFQRQGFVSEATRFYEFVIAQDDIELAGESRLQIGIMCFANSDFETAKHHFSEAMNQCQTTSNKSEAAYWLARTSVKNLDHEHAVELFKSIVKEPLEEKLLSSILFDGAVAAAQTGDDGLALQWLEMLRTQFPDNALVAESMKFEIAILQKRGNSKKSLALIQRVRAQPDSRTLSASLLESEGRGLYANQRYREAADVFEQLLQRNENHDENITDQDLANWRYLKSVCHLGMGELAEAQTELNQLQSNSISAELQPLVQIAIATVHLRTKNFDSAISAYREYLRIAPDGNSAERARSEVTICFAEADRWEEASTAFDDLEKHHASSPFLLVNSRFLATRADQKAKTGFAKKWYRILADPANPADAIEQGLSGLAWLNVESEDSQTTFEDFDRLITEFPENAEGGKSILAHAYFLEQHNDGEQAARYYDLIIVRLDETRWANLALLRKSHLLQKSDDQESIRESKALLLKYLALPQPQPSTDEALYQLSWLNHDLGLADESQNQFLQIVTDHPDSKYWPDSAYRLVQTAFSNREFETAKPLIEKLIERTDAPPEIISRSLFLKGQIAAGDNQWQTVADSMRALLTQCNDDRLKTKSEYWLAESLYRLEQFDDAIEIFLGLVPKISTVDAQLKPWIHLRTAQCLGKQGDWTQAAECAKQAKSDFPDFKANYEFVFILGRALEDEGRLVDARSEFEKVVNSEQGGTTETAAIAQWRIGETYFHQEDYKQAINAYYKLDSLFSYPQWRSAALMQAGKCQEQLHRNQHAIKLYTQLIETFPTSRYAGDASARRKHLLKQDPAQRTGKATQPSAPEVRR